MVIAAKYTLTPYIHTQCSRTCYFSTNTGCPRDWNSAAETSSNLLTHLHEIYTEITASCEPTLARASRHSLHNMAKLHNKRTRALLNNTILRACRVITLLRVYSTKTSHRRTRRERAAGALMKGSKWTRLFRCDVIGVNGARERVQPREVPQWVWRGCTHTITHRHTHTPHEHTLISSHLSRSRTHANPRGEARLICGL